MSKPLQDIQSTHLILQIFGKAKILSEAILDSLPIAFLIIDEAGTIFKANDWAARLLGVQTEDSLGLSLSQIFKSEDWNELHSQLPLILKSPEKVTTHELELPIQRTTGPEQPYLWQVSPYLEDPKHNLQLYTVLGQDVSELRATISELFRLEKEFEITQTIQALVLPKANQINSPNFKLTSYFRSAEKAGGDWWWGELREGGSLRMIVGDVTGHGIGAAMVTAIVSGSYHASRKDPDVHSIFETLNTNLVQQCQSKYWMSLCIIEIYPDTGKVKYWSAASPPALILRLNGTVEVIKARGAFLGSTPLELGSTSSQLQRGERIFAFTDGVYEFKTTQGHMYSWTNLKGILAETQKLSLEDSKWHIQKTIDELRGATPYDDITFVLAEYI